jgi:hypothetical protein
MHRAHSIRHGCNESLHVVGRFGLPFAYVALPELHSRFECCPESHSTGAFLSTCLAMFCTSATFTATAFPSPSPACHFCAHLTFHHSPSCPISHFPPRFPYAFLTALYPFWRNYYLDTGFERLLLVRLPCWRHSWRRLILYFPKSPKALQSDFFTFYCTRCWKFTVVHDNRTLMSHGYVAGHTETLSWYILQTHKKSLRIQQHPASAFTAAIKNSTRTGQAQASKISQTNTTKHFHTFICRHPHASPEAGTTAPSQHANRCAICEEIPPTQAHTQLSQSAINK